jgi:hypothetical protein
MLEDLVERVFREELIGQDPFRREWLWHASYSVAVVTLYRPGIVSQRRRAGRRPA